MWRKNLSKLDEKDLKIEELRREIQDADTFKAYIWNRVNNTEMEVRKLECELEKAEAKFSDIKELTRHSLEGVTVDTNFIDQMSKEQRLDFCEKASDVVKNPTFKRTLDYLISQQVDFTVKRAESMEQVLFGRATINGLSLVKEEFERLAALAEEKPAPKMTKEEEGEVI